MKKVLKPDSISSNKPLRLMLVNPFLYYPTPKSLNYNGSFGLLAGLFSALQIVTVISLAMYYIPRVEWGFASVDVFLFNTESISFSVLALGARIKKLLWLSTATPRTNVYSTLPLKTLVASVRVMPARLLPWYRSVSNHFFLSANPELDKLCTLGVAKNDPASVVVILIVLFIIAHRQKRGGVEKKAGCCGRVVG